MPIETTTLDTASKLETFMNAVVDQIKERHITLNTAKAHGGRFTLEDIENIPTEELTRLSTEAPAIYLDWTEKGNRVGDSSNETEDITLALAVVTKDQSPLDRHVLMTRMVESIENQISENNWGNDTTLQPENLGSTNLYHQTLDATGITLSNINWTQRIEVK